MRDNSSTAALRRAALILLASSVALAACGGGGDDHDSTPSGDALVQRLIEDNTTDSAEPVEIDDLDLEFSEDEDAFAGFFD